MSSVDKSTISRIIYHLRFRMIDDRSLFGWFDSIVSGEEKAERIKKEMAAAKSHAVFVASPSDCKHLRDKTKEVLDRINKGYGGGIIKLNYYMWEEHKEAGETRDYQGDIFSEAKERWGNTDCNVLIIFTWYKFGEGTKKEFEKYIGEIEGNPNKKLIFCDYAESIPRDADFTTVKKLDEWTQSIEGRIAPLGRVRGSVKSIDVFEQELEHELRRYLERDKEK